MSKQTDWYLVELDRLLLRRVPAEKRGELVTEIEDHFQSAAMEESEAETINKLGSPKKLALLMLNSNTADEPRWVRIVASVCLFLIPILFLVAMVNRFGPPNFPWILVDFALVAIAFASILAFRKLRIRDTLLPLVFGLIVTGVGLSFTCYDLGSMDGHLIMPKTEISRIQKTLQKNKELLATVESQILNQEMGEFLNDRIVAIHILRTDFEFSSETVTVKNLDEAMKLWQNMRLQAIDSLTEATQHFENVQQTLTFVTDARTRPGWQHGLSIVFWSVWDSPGVILSPLLINLVGFLVREIWRRNLLPRRRYAQ